MPRSTPSSTKPAWNWRRTIRASRVIRERLKERIKGPVEDDRPFYLEDLAGRCVAVSVLGLHAWANPGKRFSRPRGRNRRATAYPALKRRAIVERPSDALFCCRFAAKFPWYKSTAQT